MKIQRDAGFARRGLILVFITLLIDVIGITLIIPVLPRFLGELTGDNLSKSAIDGGLLLMVYALMQFLFAPIIGGLSDRFGRRPILLTSIITLAIDNLICAFAWSYPILFVGRILSGVSGASHATCAAYIADISNDQTRTRNFGLIGMAFGVGFIFGPALGGFLGSYSPRLPFYVAALLSFINFVFAWIMLPETLSKRHRRRFNIKRANPFGSIVQLQKYPNVLWVAIAFFVYWLYVNVWPSSWTFVAKARYDWSESAIGLSYAIFGTGEIFVMGVLLPFLTKRWSDWRITMVGLIFSVFALVGYTFAIQGWMVFLVYFFTMPETLGMASIRAIAAGQVPPNAQGELQGAFSSIMSITSVLAPLLYTFLFEKFTSATAPFYFPAVPFIAALIFVILTLLIFAFKVRIFPKKTQTL